MAIWIEAVYNSIVRTHPVSVEPLTIGRSSQANIKIDDELLSSIHCRISLRLGRAYLEDMQSKNGTYVNHTRFSSGQLRIKDLVKIGNTSVRLLESKMNPAEKAAHND